MSEISPRALELLEKIFERSGTGDEVKGDPNFCLEHFLEDIEHQLTDEEEREYFNLRPTISEICGRGSLEYRRRERQKKVA